ncbi:16S rRNA (cytosine(1402)-N(4))-methyltransferase RsmH [Actinokineospora pegani]|uniref:16S rRNA (cytosine(1402)-N(4))-methyltransferase RsmH n=1 Tax=Actinokineospora pegani TaxID=2654637 RepID=UPI0012EA8315|nr:16S rRNA (cytosine(1402)-N(4))-methyltransferase RsmH [Actinokineospora pegani]
MTDRPRHVPVLLERIVDLFAPALADRDAVLVDATLGLGGHADALLTANPRLTLVGLDRDPQALALAGERLAPHGDRVHLVHTVYDGLPAALSDLGLSRVDGVLFDLGVSSMQLDLPERGFAYSRDSPLDMRMDPTTGPTAADVLNTYSHGDLARVLHEYGEERYAGKIASAVLKERDKTPFTTSARLVQLLYSVLPQASLRTGGHPAKRTFQALRVEVNAELEVLRRAIPAGVAALRVGGRIVVESYQSLEDRIVKRCLTELSRSTAPPDLPVELPEHAPQLRMLTRGAEQADERETERNSRAQPVRLRAAERTREAP